MKITDVKVFELYAERPADPLSHDTMYAACLVRVDTDEGMFGIAEVDSMPSVVHAVIAAPTRSPLQRGLREILLGQDPLAIEARWRDMMDQTSLMGRRGVVMHAISAVDIALWDLRGRVEGRSLASLLGGARHDRLAGYVTIGLDRMSDEVATLDAARSKLDAILTTYRPRAVKVAARRFWHDEPALAARLIHLARERLGPDRLLMVDAISAFDSADEVKRMLPVFHECDVHWLEAPLPLDDLEGHRALSDCGIPLGVGDLGLTAPAEWRPYFESGVVGIAQPELTQIGGLTGLRALYDLAERNGCQRVIPHGWNTTLTLGINLQIMSARDEADYVEFSTSQSPLRWCVTRETIELDDEGYLRPPDGPGHGLTIDWEGIEAYRR